MTNPTAEPCPFCRRAAPQLNWTMPGGAYSGLDRFATEPSSTNSQHQFGVCVCGAALMYDHDGLKIVNKQQGPDRPNTQQPDFSGNNPVRPGLDGGLEHGSGEGNKGYPRGGQRP